MVGTGYWWCHGPFCFLMCNGCELYALIAMIWAASPCLPCHNEFGSWGLRVTVKLSYAVPVRYYSHSYTNVTNRTTVTHIDSFMVLIYIYT